MSTEDMATKIRLLEEQLTKKDKLLLETQPKFVVPDGMTREQCKEVFRRLSAVQMKKYGSENFVIKNTERDWAKEDREANGGTTQAPASKKFKTEG